MSVLFIVAGEPVPKGRPRFNRATGKPYTPRETVAYEDMVATYAMKQGQRFEGPVSVTVTFKCKPRGDIDNLAKAVLDGLQKGRLLADDSQVHKLCARFGEPGDGGPCVVVEVAALVPSVTTS